MTNTISKIKLKYDYHEFISRTETELLGQRFVPPTGALGGLSSIKNYIVHATNTNIVFNLQSLKLPVNYGLGALDTQLPPKNFNWRENGDEKKRNLVSIPGNQMLCGSCWAISVAGIVSDNFVISGIVEWKPNLSTTWSLACYPQLQCKGGNPATLFEDIHKNGIATKHCVDYSWCDQNKNCNGKATKHFKQEKVHKLSIDIPNCGCYDSSKEHYLYFIDKPKSVSIGIGGFNEDNFTNYIKKQIHTYGPVLGAFLVFKNFMDGSFTKLNGGVYLEKGVYGKEDVHFDDDQLNTKTHFKGSHAIAIIGWGIEKNVIINNANVKKDIPYWYCRNSWTPEWGDGGYFKMAMYPHNTIVQFDKIVIIETTNGKQKSGGMILIKASEKPKKQFLKEIESKFSTYKKEKNTYYISEKKDIPKPGHSKLDDHKLRNNILKFILIGLGILIIIIIFYLIVKIFVKRRVNNKNYRSVRRKNSKRKSYINVGDITGRSGNYFFI